MFKQKFTITMIYTSSTFYVQNNDVTYTYCINSVDVITRHQKLLLTCIELPTVKIRELQLLKECSLLTGTNISWKIKIFCSCKLPKKHEPHQNFTCYKKQGGSGLTLRQTEYQK